MPNFKDILQKLSVFKNNIPLLMSVIITLIAVILLVVTHFLIGVKLEKAVQANSIKTGQKIKKEFENARSAQQTEMLRTQLEDYAKDANNITLLAQQSTMRELLSYDVFRDPNKILSTAVFREFGKHYRKAIDDLLLKVGAGDCPTEAQIQKGIEDSAVNSRLRRSRTGMMGGGMMGGMPGQSAMPTPGAPKSRFAPMTGMGMGRSLGAGSPYGGSPYGLGTAKAGSARGFLSRSMRIGELEAMVVEEICRERAGSLSVYAYPADLSGYEFWQDYKLAVEPNQALQDCWYFQLAFWVIEDIFDTISSVNSDYESVLTAPVKQLKQMSFNMGLKRPGAGGSTGRRRRGGLGRPGSRRRDDVDRPAYVHSNDDGLAESCTGRFTTPDSDIDVIHFNLTAVIEVKSIMPFMQELCSAKEHKFRGFDGGEQPQSFQHNQITVLESKFMSAGNEPYSLYDYGDNPVVELDLICEYIFNKKGYEKIKPETVRQSIIAAADTSKKGRRR
ncbi:MAG: hypothetical protein JW837_08320 [Sedimentisphaerales bacterium]|nr:hypothetical protein [Sedimentisphaerales bacterium]